MKKPRRLSEIREDITALRRQIRRAEEDGVNWREVARAKQRLLELQSEEFRAMGGGKLNEPDPGSVAV